MLLSAPYLYFFLGKRDKLSCSASDIINLSMVSIVDSCCQRFTNQPIVFCVVRPTLNSLALAKRAVSLFPSRAAALVSRVSQLRRSRARALLSLNLKKKRHRSQSKGRYTPKGICLSGWRCVNKTVIRKTAV